MNTTENIVCSKWSSFLATGIAMIGLGLLALSSTYYSTLATVGILGIIIAAAGVAQIINAFYNPEWKGFLGTLLLGILATVAGVLMITNPTTSAASLTLLLGSYFIASGLFRIAISLYTPVEYWGWLLINGILSIAVGGMILAQWPEASLWVIGAFIAVDLLVSGTSYLILSFDLHSRCSERTDRR